MKKFIGFLRPEQLRGEYECYQWIENGNTFTCLLANEQEYYLHVHDWAQGQFNLFGTFFQGFIEGANSRQKNIKPFMLTEEQRTILLRKFEPDEYSVS